MLFIGFGGKVVNVDAFGAKLELNGSNGKKGGNEELKMEMKEAKEGVKC